MNYFFKCGVFFSILFYGCKQNNQSYSIQLKPILKSTFIAKKAISKLEKYFISKNLVDIHSLDTTIKVSLAYSTSENFLHKIIYDNLKKCYLPCDVAIKLSNAQFNLQQHYPTYHLIVFDATRPLSAQQKMWDELDLPTSIKINYLAHPSDISLHNYGAAVDVGMITDTGLLLDMGTDFDSFEELSQPRNEARFFKDGVLTKEAYNNRLILRKAMQKAGFTTISSEWWHFNSTNKFIAENRYELIQ